MLKQWTGIYEAGGHQEQIVINLSNGTYQDHVFLSGSAQSGLICQGPAVMATHARNSTVAKSYHTSRVATTLAYLQAQPGVSLT